MRDLTGRRTIAGLFHDREGAERAINDLKDAGFSPDQVGVAMRDRDEQGKLIEDTGTKAAEGAVAGAVGGGLLGGLVGFLVGIGALAIPGIGPVLAGGALATAFGLGGGTAVAGAGIGAAAGGIAGALVGMGIPEEEAKHFESGFRAGGVLVTVNAGPRTMDALAILERNGADTGPGSVGSRGDAGTSTGRADSGTPETAGGGLAGAGAGAVAGTAIGGPGLGTAAGAAIGAAGGAAAGRAVHEGREPSHRDHAEEGGAGGGVAGGATGAVVGGAVAGPAGVVPGAAIGGAAGAAAGAGAGGRRPEDDDDEWTTDADGNRVRRSRPAQ
jgi:hypothetical protein